MKYNAIGDLISENMELKRRLRNQEIKHLEINIANFKLFRPALKDVKGFDINKCIKTMEEKLEELK